MCAKMEASADCEVNSPLFLSPLVAAGSHQVWLAVGELVAPQMFSRNLLAL